MSSRTERLALLVAAVSMLPGGVALGEVNSAPAAQQEVRLVAPRLSAPEDLFAGGVRYEPDAPGSPFIEEGPTAPAPEDEGYQRPAAEPPLRPAAQPLEPEQFADDAPVYRAPPPPAGPKPWRLPQPRVLQAAGITMGGWLQQGITLNAQVPQDRLNGPIATNDRHAEWQMNQLWLFFEKPIDNGGYGWDLGGRLDMVYGSDYRFGLNWGLEDKINGVDQFYGLVIPQMYAEVAYNDLSVKLGHFAGILSYEQVPSVANFFYSHSYAMYFTEPLLVTGLLADYKLTDQWSLLAGFHRGWMMWEDLNDELDFMGGVKWVSLDKSTSISYTVDVGPQDVAGDQNRFAHSLLIQRQLTEKLRYVLQQNLGHENNGDPRSNQDAEWYGINQYLIYRIDDAWSAGVRIEWLRDQKGLFYGPGNLPDNSRAWAGGPGFAGDWFEMSWGLNWRPCPNMVVRPELRYDSYSGTRDVKGNLPFDDGNKAHQFTVAADMIITY